MPELSLSLLGRPRIARDGVPVTINRRKTLALLTYLAVTGEPHRREKLAALFWPRHPRESARAALRNTLTEIRHAIGEQWIETEGELVGLRFSEGLSLDVREFISLLDRIECPARAADSSDLPQLKQVAELYRSDFLSEFFLDSNSTFSEWQYFQAEALRKRVIVTLDRLIDGHASGGEHELAIAYARRRLRIDPLEEKAHRQLMRLYAATGQYSLAIRQYRECSRVIEREFSTKPEEETGRLYQDIIARHPVAAREPAPVRPKASAQVTVTAPRQRGALSRAFLRSPGGMAAIAGLVLAVAGAAVSITVLTAPRPRTIAVLPFEGGSSGDPARDFISGMEDALLTELAKAPGLVVRPGKIGDAEAVRKDAGSRKEIAEAIDAELLVEGSAFLVGEKVRVSLRLFDAHHNQFLWAAGFERTLFDPLSIQASVARDAVRQIRGKLGLE